MVYKNILWIDDLDDKNSNFEDDFLEREKRGENSKEIIKSINKCFYEQAKNVELVQNYMEALKKLGSSSEQYDLVVFDINMKEGADADEFNDIKKELKMKRVKVDDSSEKKSYKEFLEKAGMYLYLFLLNCGYPNERMVILTGNSLEEPRKFLEEAHLYAEEIRILEKEEITGKDWIDELYETEYYRIRRLVYKACEYWKEKLGKETNIVFNEIYFGTDKDIQLEKGSFVNMLDRIELLFPVKQPSEPNNVYYQALQVVSMFHEESAVINKVDNNGWEDNRCYHQSVRNFRNWSSHNKFNDNKLEGCLFAFIFCMALRTYFVGDDKKQFGNEIEYEKEYFESCKEVNMEYDDFREKYENTWKHHFEKVQDENKAGENKKNKKNIEWGYKGINELLVDSGRCKNGHMKFVETVVNILEGWMEKKGEWEAKDREYTYMIAYQWKDKFKKEEFKEKLQEMYQDGQKNRWWEYYAYELFVRLSEEQSK